MSIGANIKNLRKSRDLTQLELAKALGVSDKAVSAWENDSKTPRMGTIEKLAQMFKINKSDILDDSVKPVVDANLQMLIDNYNRLNLSGRDKLLEYSYDLIGNTKYIEVLRKKQA